MRVTEELPDDVQAAACTVADYLVAFWDEPCYDAWEEGRTQQHTSTLASLCAGLRADGHFTKYVRNRAVDASLLWLATPFDLVRDNDPVFARTLELI